MDGMTTSINSILNTLIRDFNTLLDCPARFSGEFNEQKIHCFVEYIEYYKRIKCITDDQALRELQYLLVDHAYNWWMRRKDNIETWSEALTILENKFSKKRPAYKVYEEILRHPYDAYLSKCDFIDDKMELFTELDQSELTEKNKLDIIYALLPNDEQKKIKVESIMTVKDLKKKIKLVKSVNEVLLADQMDAVMNFETRSDISTDSAESQSTIAPNKESACQEVRNQISFEKDSIGESEKDPPVIKVRRTEDLMPKDIKEEDENPEEIISTKYSDSRHENFQIDSDIMNQINNIIDETERNIEAIKNIENASSISSQTSNSVITLEFLGFQIEPAKRKESANQESKSLSLNCTKKTKKRCTYCRNSNHTAQVCFKRAKHLKLFPERFLQGKPCESNNLLNDTNSEAPSDSSSSTILKNNLSVLNTQTIEISTASPNITNITSNITSPTGASTVCTSPSAILNNVSERCTNSALTTKLIPAINGKAPNKILAAKLRNMNSPSPKCHQCGAIGFYKSICPNCSPIYNNNSHK